MTVFDVGQDETDGLLFLVMDFVHDRDLATVLTDDGPPPVEVALGWAEQTCA